LPIVCFLGENRDIFFPKLSENLHLTTFAEIAVKYLTQLGYEPYECESEDEARDRSSELIKQKNGLVIFSRVIRPERKILKNSTRKMKLLI
jgi:hypothetical protein